MEVIIVKNIPNLGHVGDKVKVADGYARNYLIPMKAVVEASKKNLKLIEHDKKMFVLRENKKKKQLEKLASQIRNLSCTIAKEVGENDKLFGSVSANDILTWLKGEGINIEKKAIKLDDSIKALGIYNVIIKLHPEIETKLKVWVVKS